MKSPGKCLVLLTVLYLLGGVLDSRVPGVRSDWALLGASIAPGQVQKRDPEPTGSKPSSGISQPKSGGIREPPFLKHAFLFDPDSVELSAESRSAIRRAATWLREHREIRILIVGFCDPSGSEECTHALAERRGTVVEQLLVKYGGSSSQIVAAKGWEWAEPVCAAVTPACQAMNRRARIFIAGPVH